METFSSNFIYGQLGDYLNPLMMSCFFGNIDTVKVLIDKNADLNKKTRLVDVDFFYFIPYPIFRDMITVLITACASENNDKKKIFEIIKLLIAKGADINETSISGKSALMFICESSQNDNNYEIIKLLIDNKAKINIKDSSDRTALDYLDKEKNPLICKLLTDIGK